MTAVPRVSILMTTYNRERYVAAAIESTLAQTFGDFELIITDDCSTDGTLAIIRTYAARDPRIRLFVNERNLGQFGNRNRAATHARAPFLKFHDSDDLMYPHCLETMVRLLEAEPRAGFLLSGSSNWHGGPCPMLLSPRLAYEREFLGFGLFMLGPACALFRADVFRGLGGFADHGIPSDHLFWLRACREHAVLLAPADLFWYRQHAGQQLRSSSAEREYAVALDDVWQALHHPGCPLEGESLHRARTNHVYTVGKLLWRDVTRGRLGLAAMRLSACGLSPRDWVRYLRRPRRSWLAGTPLAPDGAFIVPDWLKAGDAAETSGTRR